MNQNLFRQLDCLQQTYTCLAQPFLFFATEAISSGSRVLSRAKNYTHTADGNSMNRVLTALACLTLLLVSVPLTSAQAPTAAVSMTCDQNVHEFTDSLTNQSIVVVCTVNNPTTYQEKISIKKNCQFRYLVHMVQEGMIEIMKNMVMIIQLDLLDGQNKEILMLSFS